MRKRSIKVQVTFERREDGGLRVWSPDVPGLVLSHTDIDGVLADVKTALEVILSEKWGKRVEAAPLDGYREMLEDDGIVDRKTEIQPGQREYVAYVN